MNELTLQPLFDPAALRGELALLREELAHLLTREDELRHIVRPNLLALTSAGSGRGNSPASRRRPGRRRRGGAWNWSKPL